MNKFLNTGIFILLILIQSSANAATGSSAGKITTIQWYEGHVGVLVKQEGMSDLGGCGRSDHYILDENHAYFKEIYSLILTAHISSQPLILYLDGCVQGISRIKHVTSRK
jgi:hypothetical protein